MKWKRQTPEHESGDYWFNGKCVATRGVAEEIPKEEVIAIAQDVNRTAKESGGIDYLQTYIHEKTKKKVWVIDQVTKADLENGQHPVEHNYFTILFPHEY